MSANGQRSAPWILCVIVALALGGSGCGGGGNDGGSAPTARFVASPTGAGPDRVRLVGAGASGDLMSVDVVIGGPTTSTDLYAFDFALNIGDLSVLEFVAGSAAVGDALSASGCAGGPTALASANNQDPSLIVVGVSKLGSCAGNAIAAGEPAIVRLTFRVLASGVSSLAISTTRTPSAIDSSLDPIPSVSFDSEAATIQSM
jgi:hypothetical protein